MRGVALFAVLEHFPKMNIKVVQQGKRILIPSFPFQCCRKSDFGLRFDADAVFGGSSGLQATESGA
jgi:hypothetical protein